MAWGDGCFGEERNLKTWKKGVLMTEGKNSAGGQEDR